MPSYRAGALAAALLLLVQVTCPVAAATAGGARDVAAPPAGGYFATLPPGAPLPSESECAQRVHRSAWEPRAVNSAMNRTTPGGLSLPDNPDFDSSFDSTFQPRITGNFVGTTEEIIQWASCKWGFDDDITRAQAVTESNWRMDLAGDLTWRKSWCPADERRASPCPQSFGILQIKARYNPGTYPASRTMTAFHLDYALAERRGCYEGMQQHLGDDYGPGDLWGCIGNWFSGGWHDSQALAYIESVQEEYTSKPWRGWAHEGTSSPATTD